MGNNIIKNFQEYYAARKDVLEAKSDISISDSMSGANVCRKNLEFTGKTTPVVCKHFQADDFCDNPNCPMFGENARYIFALRKYKEARSEFISSLVFWHSK